MTTLEIPAETQCPAVITHWSATSVPPQACCEPMYSATVPGHAPTGASVPPTIECEAVSTASSSTGSEHAAIARTAGVSTKRGRLRVMAPPFAQGAYGGGCDRRATQQRLNLYDRTIG